MTDRIKGFVVVLHHDMRDDDVEGIKSALLHVKGVIAVEASVADPDDFINREQVRQELEASLREVLKQGKS